MRDFLKGLDLDSETIDTIMAEHGKYMTKLSEDNNTLKAKIDTYESEIKTLKESSKDNNDWKSKFESLEQKIKQQEAEEKAKQEDETLTNNIVSAFGDKKFSSDYVKNGLITDIKAELKKSENAGKGIKEIFEFLTKDKEGIFENPNKPAGMPGMGDGKIDFNNSADDFVSIIQENQRK